MNSSTLEESKRKGPLDAAVQSQSKTARFSALLWHNSLTANRVRWRHTMGQVLDCVAEPVAFVDLDGQVEMATKAAGEGFGVRAGMALRELPFPYAAIICDEAMTTGRAIEGEEKTAVRVANAGTEHFFVPKAVPLLGVTGESLGAILSFVEIEPSTNGGCGR